MRPGRILQPRRQCRASHLAGMLRLPLGDHAVQVPPDLRRPLAHHLVERLQFRDLAGYRVEGQAMIREGLRELGVCGDHRGAEGADRSLLLEQGRGGQCSPLPACPHPGADLEVDMPVRITRTTRLVRDRDGLHVLDREDFLRAARPRQRDRVSAEEPPYLPGRVPLRHIQRLRHFGVQSGGDRQALGGVDRHLREQWRPLPNLAGLASGAH